MKTIVMSSLLLFSGAALAAQQLVITSFYFSNRDPQRLDSGAEICGHVVGATGNEKVLLTVDPGPRQGEYVALVSPSGKFCHVVDTKTGRAQGSIIGSTLSVTVNAVAR